MAEIQDIREREERLHKKRLLEAEIRDTTKEAVVEDAPGAGGEHTTSQQLPLLPWWPVSLSNPQWQFLPLSPSPILLQPGLKQW